MKILRTLMSSIKFNIIQKLDHYSNFYPSSLSMKQMLNFGNEGNETASFLFLRQELLVRLANIMKEINLLPPNLLNMPSVKIVHGWYEQSFEDLLQFEAATPEPSILTRFSDDLKQILHRHSKVVETMAEGLIELKMTHGVDITVEKNLQYFLDRFYLNRFSIRMLINQHTLLFGDGLPETQRHVGCIDPKCDVEMVLRDAYENAKFLCDQFYLASPSYKLERKNAVDQEFPISVAYVPSHLYHIMFELFKNAMRATVEYNGAEDELPHLKVFVVKGKEDLSIKLCDRGGGVSRSVIDLLFNYMYTTAPPPIREAEQTPLAGYGYGLPLSRLYARYFNGDLCLMTMEGYGTDACVYLKTLSSEASEVLPVYGARSRRFYKEAVTGYDWSSPSYKLWSGNSAEDRYSR